MTRSVLRPSGLAGATELDVRYFIAAFSAIAILFSGLGGVANATTHLEKCGKVTGYDFVESLTNPGTLRVDDVAFVVGLPGGFRRADIPTLTVPFAGLRLDQTVCVRGEVDPLPNAWHVLSGEVVITNQPSTLPATGTTPLSEVPTWAAAELSPRRF